ncbi:MAG: mechanosensitive ion channel family protein [Bryobacteraceae bacterium]
MPHRDYLSPDYYVPLLFNGLRIGLILIFAYIGTLLVGRLILALRKYALRMMLKAGGGTEFELEKRADTVGGVMRKSLVTLIWTVALIMALREMNFDIRPLLAGAGVVGVAVGFGAQSLIKDVLAGFFLLIENQMRVNDVVVIDGTGGLVEEINLRTTSLRSEDGAVHIFPNGGIQKLSNLTRDFSYYVFSISVDYKDDTDRVAAVLSAIAAQLTEEEPYKQAILAPLEVMGVDKLGDSAAVVKARLKTLPMKQWMVGREMNSRIKKRFAEEGIALPFPAQTIYLNGNSHDELKEVIREVLAEPRPPGSRSPL